jgi:hypothetical protein
MKSTFEGVVRGIGDAVVFIYFCHGTRENIGAFGRCFGFPSQRSNSVTFASSITCRGQVVSANVATLSM